MALTCPGRARRHRAGALRVPAERAGGRAAAGRPLPHPASGGAALDDPEAELTVREHGGAPAATVPRVGLALRRRIDGAVADASTL